MHPAIDSRPAGYLFLSIKLVMLMIMVRMINKLVRRQLDLNYTYS